MKTGIYFCAHLLLITFHGKNILNETQSEKREQFHVRLKFLWFLR